jgi:predicted transcriptional regulator
MYFKPISHTENPINGRNVTVKSIAEMMVKYKNSVVIENRLPIGIITDKICVRKLLEFSVAFAQFFFCNAK